MGRRHRHLRPRRTVDRAADQQVDTDSTLGGIRPADHERFDHLAEKIEYGIPLQREELLELARLVPRELAGIRRGRVGGPAKVGALRPVSINGSPKRGANLGYFQTFLRDGTRGYHQRHFGDCMQMAIATCLQIRPDLVPNLHLDRLVCEGRDPEEIDRMYYATMNPWAEGNGLRIVEHAVPPSSERRWIGVVRAPDYMDHCLVMSRSDFLFDPAGDVLGNDYADPADIDYGITVERR